MNKQTTKHSVVIAIIATLTIGTVSPGWAAPMLSNVTGIRELAPSSVIDVRYYRGRHYRNNGAGAALGALAAFGAVAGAAAYGSGYYGPGYCPRQGYYGYGRSPYYHRYWR